MFASDLHSVNSDHQSDNTSCASAAPRVDCGFGAIGLTDLAGLLGIPMPASLASVTFQVRRIKPGETLHRAGDKFGSIYVIRSGFLKTVSVDAGGTELVLGFPMGGDVVGLDGFDSGRYTADVVALDMSNVAVIPFARLARLAREHPCVEHLLYSIFSRELVQEHRMVRLLGTMSAEARLARFLLDLADRFGWLGYSRTSFTLRMTRQEIGSYLGLKLETVSRMLSAFAAAHLIEVDRRAVTLCNMTGLRRILEPESHDRADHHNAQRSRTVERFTRDAQWMAPMALAA